ncbi:hypothetical protein [Burkholderia vietnamiensis]|uniref:hypothetical protein n=1 Tax=Burkholderia vietnamiensis TaxID=60552 RepID=UPI001F5EC082|nr:hypothetical protein [Burkholderia vietnamiensis]
MKINNVSDQVQPIGSDSDKFDTIVVPARDEGFKDTFLDKNCWYAVRINAKHISKLRYIAAYQVAPIAAITHIAEIESIVPCSGLMNPDTDLGENGRHEEVSDEQATTYVFPGVQTASRLSGARPGL